MGNEVRFDGQFAPVGSNPPVIEKRQADSRIYTIDCSQVLRPDELAAGASAPVDQGVQVESVRTRAGRYLEMRVSGGPTGGDRFKTHLVDILLLTTEGQLAVQVAFKVHP